MTVTAPVAAPDVVVPEPHAERPARPGEVCSYCPRRAFVIYLTDAGEVAWCGQPERTAP